MHHDASLYPTARQQFGALQHKVFPVYFVQSIALSAALLAVWVFKHPDVATRALQPWYVDVFQAYALGTVLVGQGLNFFVVGPMTSKCACAFFFVLVSKFLSVKSVMCTGLMRSFFLQDHVPEAQAGEGGRQGVQ